MPPEIEPLFVTETTLDPVPVRVTPDVEPEIGALASLTTLTLTPLLAETPAPPVLAMDMPAKLCSEAGAAVAEARLKEPPLMAIAPWLATVVAVKTPMPEIVPVFVTSPAAGLTELVKVAAVPAPLRMKLPALASVWLCEIWPPPVSSSVVPA